MSETSIKDFESAIAELEKIVKQLEDGDLPLDKSLALFERIGATKLVWVFLVPPVLIFVIL